MILRVKLACDKLCQICVEVNSLILQDLRGRNLHFYTLVSNYKRKASFLIDTN